MIQTDLTDLFLVTHLAEPFFPLVRGHLMAFSFLTTRHSNSPPAM